MWSRYLFGLVPRMKHYIFTGALLRHENIMISNIKFQRVYTYLEVDNYVYLYKI